MVKSLTFRSKLEGSDSKILHYMILRETGHFMLRHEKNDENCQHEAKFARMTDLIHYYARKFILSVNYWTL